MVIAGLTLIYVLGLPTAFRHLMGLEEVVKMGFSVLLIAPLAFAMGMPFPLGLASVAGRTPVLVPWAWAVNGFASVVAAILATVLAIHWGFNAVLILATVLYLTAAINFPGK